MIYIQKSDIFDNIPHHFDCSCVMYGAIETDQEFKLISYNELISGDYDNKLRTNLFVGSVEFMREVFNRLNVGDIRVPRNSNRDEEVTTLGEVKKRVLNGEVLFTKPTQIKYFTGMVLTKKFLGAVDIYEDDTEVYVSKPFQDPIISEHRCYVNEGKIVDTRNYMGDPMVSIDDDFAKKVVEKNKDFPVSYTMDIAVLSTKESVVVEFNDMWAIGNYGIPNDLYLRLLKNRYVEIIKTISN